MPLPFWTEPKVPSNKTTAINRLMSLAHKLLENQNGKSVYMAFMNDLIKNGDAEPGSKSQVHSTYHVNYTPY